MQVYVQKLTTTTLPSRSADVRRGELSHSVARARAANSRGSRSLASAVPSMPNCAAAIVIAAFPTNLRRSRSMTSPRGAALYTAIHSLAYEITHLAGQRHFPVASLEAALHCGLHPPLVLGVAHALEEESGVATVLLGRRQRDRIDPILDDGLTGGRKPRDPMREGSHEVAERGGREGSIDPSVSFGQIGVVILCAEHHLERAGPAHEAHEVLRAAGARDHAECRLELPEDR